MKLFARTGGHWLFYISAAYLLASFWSWLSGVPAIWLAPVYVIMLGMPFWFPPLGRAINLSVDWDRKMFDFFKNKSPEKGNVVPFPEKGLQGPQGYVVPPEPEKEKPATTYYRLGLTDNNRVSFQMGYSEITMNRAGCQQLIDQIAFFQSQLHEESDDGAV